jgi:hypothetical protein
MLSSPLNPDWMNYMNDFGISVHFKRTGSAIEEPDPAREAVGVPAGKNGINSTRYTGSIPTPMKSAIGLHHQYAVFVKPNEHDMGSLRCPWKITGNGSALVFFHPSGYSFGMLEWLEHVLQLLKEYANVTCNGSIRFVGREPAAEGNPHWVRSCRGTITVSDSIVSVAWAKHADEHIMKPEDDIIWKNPRQFWHLVARPDERQNEYPLVPLSWSRCALKKNRSKLPLHGEIKMVCPKCLEPCGVNTLLFKHTWCSICSTLTLSGDWLQEDTKPGAWDRQRDRALAFAMGVHGGRLGENSVLWVLNLDLVKKIWRMQLHT